MSTAEKFLTPVGRLVQGDLFEAQTKDAQGNLRVVKKGPNMGQPNPQYFIAVAFAKNDPAWPAFFAILDRVARAGFPNLFPNPQQGCVHPGFAWKVVDGDGVDSSGKPNSAKEGFAGHWVVRFASSYAPRCFHKGQYAPHEQITDPKLIRRGFYVRVAGSVAGNGEAQKPGLYVNLDMVELSGYGPEIVSGPDAAEAFGGTAAQLPPGASPTPMATPTPGPGMTAPPMTAAPGAGPGMVAPPMTGAPAVGPGVAAPGVGVAPPVTPNTAYMTPPPQPARQMTAAANGMTYEQAIGLGWTDDLLRQHGMML